MTRDVSRFLAPDFLSLTIGIVVYFVGVLTTQRVKFLRNFSIPEPVSGGFIAVAVISLIYFVFNLEIDFDHGFLAVAAQHRDAGAPDQAVILQPRGQARRRRPGHLLDV
jgi:hypothetical protein